jgi:hypothetical protein
MYIVAVLSAPTLVQGANYEFERMNTRGKAVALSGLLGCGISYTFGYIGMTTAAALAVLFEFSLDYPAHGQHLEWHHGVWICKTFLTMCMFGVPLEVLFYAFGYY